MGLEGFANFSKKTFVVQDTIDPNISWPSEIFMTPPSIVVYYLKAYF